MIACVQIRHFATAVERAWDGALRDVPVILVHYPKQRGKVLAFSSDAESAGIRPEMALSRARALTPKGAFLTMTPERFEQALDHLLAALWTFTSQVEIDDAAFPQTVVAYLDLGSLNEPATRLLGEQLLEAVRASVPGVVSIGLAQGKFAAFIAASTGSAGDVRYVAAGTEAAFVAPYPVSLLPMSKEVARKLKQLCIHRIGELAVLKRAAMVGQFGRPGRLLHALAHGIDSRPVVPRRMPQCERAARRFEQPLTDRTRVEVVMQYLADDLHRRLEGRVAAAHHLTLTLSFERGDPRVERQHLLQPVSTAKGIAQAVLPLIERSATSARASGITGVEITLMQFVSAAPQQLELLTHRPARQLLIDLTPALVQRYGARFYVPVLVDQDHLLPQRRFHLHRVGTAS